MFKMTKVLLIALALLVCIMGVCSCEILDYGLFNPESNQSGTSDPSDPGDGIPQAVKLAYDKATELGFDGTLEEFLAICKGKDGRGVEEILIDAEGNLTVYYSDAPSTPVILGNVVGADGADGADGVGIKTATIDADGNLIIELTDGTVQNLGKVIGADGVDGADGADGVDGIDGVDGVGIETATIDESGNLIIKLTSGTELNLGKVVGEDGKDGVDGEDGKDGVDGADGKDGIDGIDGVDGVGIETATIDEDGNLIIKLTSGTELNLGKVVGEDGKDGVDGEDGKDGIDGVNGEDGKDGVDGADGKDGVDGKDGKDGIDGKDGKDGVGIEDIEINASGNLVVTLTDGTVKDLGKVTGTSVGFTELRITDKKTLLVTLSNGITIESAPIDVTFGGLINGLSIDADGVLHIYTTVGITKSYKIDRVVVSDDGEIIVYFEGGEELSFGKISNVKETECVHEYGEWTVGLAPTCTSIGYNVAVCALCEEEKIAFVEKLGHDFGDSCVIKEPNGYEDGVQLTACKVCGTAKMEFINGFSLGLSFEKTDYESYRVTGRGECEDIHIIVPDEHEGLPVTEIGEKAFYDYDDIISIRLPDTIEKVYDKAFSECEGLEEVSMPDDVEIGTDVFRGSIKVEIIIRHILVYVEYKEATCYEPGNIAYYWCETCNMYYEDEEQLVRLYDVIIPNSHNFVDGVCTKCGKIQDDILIVAIDEVAHLGKFALGTLENAIGLPANINVYTKDGATHQLPVIWDLSTYDKSSVGEYTISGIIQSGEFYYDDGLTNTISTQIEIVDFMKGTADIVFLLDISGSMGDEIANVKNNIMAFAQAIEDQGVSARWAAITFSDYTEISSEYTRVVMNGASEWFTSAADYKTAIGNISLQNGGDSPEVDVDGLMHAYNNLSTRKDARVFYILLTDADYKNDNKYGVSNMTEAANILAEDSINVSVITTTSLYSTYDYLATTTGGIKSNIYDNFANDLLEELVPIIYDEVIE